MINSGVSHGKLDIGNRFASTFLFGLQTVLIVYFGARFILAGDMTVGMLFAFMSYRQNFTLRAEGLVNNGIEFRMLGLHLERLSDIVQAEKEEGLEIPVSDTRSVSGRIELDDISFRYAHNDPLIFEKISISIKPGEFLAFAGPSGGGKTTLLKVMLGLLKPTTGDIRVDGLPLHAFGLRNWRAATGVVMQAQIHTDISRMPMQYLSMIGDMGAALSGGQRQRLLLARALYHKPKVLFLDEGTANLDEQAEKRVADVISQMDITRIVVAQRPELLRRADRVLDMIEGRLIERKSRPRTKSKATDPRMVEVATDR